MTVTRPAPQSAATRTVALTVPTPTDVIDLQRIRAYPCVSVLLRTETAARMSTTDTVRLHVLITEAGCRLENEFGRREAAGLIAVLRALAADAVGRATGAGLALFARPGEASSWRLPVAVQDRAVIDPSYATRDLVRGLQVCPQLPVLVLTEHDARLFIRREDTLVPAVGAFPVIGRRWSTGSGTEAFPRLPSPQQVDADQTSFLHAVDRALGAHLRTDPAPFVVVGPPRTVGAFLRGARASRHLAGVVAGHCEHDALPALAAIVQPAIEHYLLFRQGEAVELVDRRRSQGRAATGVRAAWRAARLERPEMLAVESGLFYPARVGQDGTRLTEAADRTHPEVLDDAVDELIETVLDRGGWIAFVDDGALAEHGRIALTVRAPGSG